MLPKNLNKTNISKTDSNEYRNIEYLNKLINKRIDDTDDEEEEYINLEEEYKDIQKTMNEIFELNNIKSTNSEINDTDEINDAYEINDEYNELKENKYFYEIENVTNNNLEDYIKNSRPLKKINICPYQINNSGLKPFLQFFLRKNNNKKLDFISCEWLYDYNSIINKCYKILEVLFLSYMKISCYEYKGFIEDDNQLYIFFDCSNSKIGVHSLHKNSEIWLVLIDEIMNSKHVCNYTIEENVVDIFLKNYELLYLKNENNIKYENPICGYTWKCNEKIQFVSIFGESRNTEIDDALLGPYYYFTSYDNAINNIKIDKDSKKKYGIIRFALFMGNMKVPLNLKDDNPDESKETMLLLMKDKTASTKEYRKIRDLLNISDRDGKWSEYYDSVCICKLNFEEDVEYNLPYFVVKIYEQQLPLSYHIINKEDGNLK